jgi:hypothetical protein
MERRDTKKQGGYEANGHGGWVTTDESTVELSGTRAEVDLIITSLRVYIAEQKKLLALGVHPKVDHGSAYHPKQVAYPDSLLKSIAEPVYEDEQVAT